ncbi:MAG: type VI secretion protein ImpB [Sphingopyxis sp.]
MRLPTNIERLYLDFDGFFASVEQQAHPQLRGRPVGVVPFAGTDRTCVIACSREAKARGVRNVMAIADARRICPDIVLVPQSPDLYRRAHNTLLAEIESVIPIDAVKSIDELTCRLGEDQRQGPRELAHRLKSTIRDNVGPYITCSIGFAANRQLAKIACKVGKPNGVTIWHPDIMPVPLFALPFDDIPGVGGNMRRRLAAAGIATTQALYNTAPKQMRRLWNNVTGERLWYALHGYDIQAPQSERGTFGHGRVLPPESRSLPAAREICRLLLIKAARRLRRDSYYCSGLLLWMAMRGGSWSDKISLPVVNDDQALLSALDTLWARVRAAYPRGTVVFRVGVTLYDLSPGHERQLDFLLNDDASRQKWEWINSAIDGLNSRYGRTVATLGHWNPPKGGHVGGKISYTRIPSAEDFW